MRRMENKGQIIIEAGANVWPHEMDTARALAKAGHTVKFVCKSNEKRVSSADALMDGELWEMKAPKSDKVSAIDKNIRKALHQSKLVIFDSRRMKRIPDAKIERELRKSASSLPYMRHLLFVNRRGIVIDIK